MRSKIIKIASLVGINQAIGFSLLARSWQIFAGPITLLLVAQHFNLAQQGFYYTFNSVLALQVVFELGLAFVIYQFASHEFTTLTWGHAGKVRGDQHAINRLHSIIKRSVIWYGGVALLMAIFVLPAGLYFFSRHEVVGFTVLWQGPWVALVLAASAYLPIIPILAAIEGSGQVAQINRLRLMQGVCASVLTWVAIFSGAGLYAASVTFIVNVAFGSGWIKRTYPVLLNAIRLQKDSDGLSNFSWKREIWPMQWRIAVSWISGYFIFQLFTPILFYYHGPVVAGQMGMSLVIANMLNTVALVWLQANTPNMAQSVARGDWLALDSTFTKVFWQSVAVSFLGSIAVITMLWILSAHPLIHRLLPIMDMVYLLIAFFLSHVIGALAHYLRMHKREPFMLLSVLGAVFVALAMWYFGRFHGSTGMVVSLMVINLVYGLPSALWLWLHLRKTWHRPIGLINE
jgi:hypothetical protein